MSKAGQERARLVRLQDMANQLGGLTPEERVERAELEARAGARRCIRELAERRERYGGFTRIELASWTHARRILGYGQVDAR